MSVSSPNIRKRIRARVTEISWSRVLESKFFGYDFSIAVYMRAMSFEARRVSFCVSTSKASRTLARTVLASRTMSMGSRMASSRVANLGFAMPVRCRWLVRRVEVELSLLRRAGQRQTCSSSL